ncbi:MAG: hypothetical protein M0Q91_15805 [Methanoregula sp.]|nr:hypothetical protein [Methanoregula sp.]
MGIILLTLLVSVGVVSANLVTNGGFETPQILNGAGWDIFPDGTAGLDWDVQWANDPSPFNGHIIPSIANAELQNVTPLSIIPAEGLQYAELDTDWDGPINTFSGEPANVTMSQVITTIPGATYHITYAQHCRSDDTHNPCVLKFEWTGSAPVVTSGLTTQWTPYAFDRTATGTSTTISFTGVNTAAKPVADSFGALIDAVDVEETSRPPAIPEFPTMALPAAFIVGLIGAVLFIQSTKQD